MKTLNYIMHRPTRRALKSLTFLSCIIVFTIIGAAYFLKMPIHVREMLSFRKVCIGWQEQEKTVSDDNDLLIYDLQHMPIDEVPVDWLNTKALERFCEPYAFVKFRPSVIMLKNEDVTDCNKPQAPGAPLCSWYPICMLGKDAISAHVNSSGVWEEGHLIDLRNRMRKVGGIDEVFMLDAGANQGIYTIWSAVLGYRVVSFEANPRLMPLLSKSLSLAGLATRVTMFNNAVSHTRGEVVMREEDGNIGASSIIKATSKGISVIKQITIDDALRAIIERHKGMGIGYMKIDIESHEAKFFTGGASFMQQYYPPFIQLEINTIIAGRSIWDGCDCALFAGLMKRLGYNRTDAFWQENVTFCQTLGTFGESTFEREVL